MANEMIGTTIAHYRITAKLGQGGMGEVYRATDTKLNREVAIKVLPEAFARDPERMARFEREARVLASLNHPNIATIHGVEDRALVMELVEGESPKGPLPFDEAWKIALQIADALEYAHDKGVIHRDLKPANVKVTPDGVVKLLDFGLAKAFSGAPEAAGSDPSNSPTITLGATVAGTIMGTAAYMAPEQARGKTVDKRADIWSWGVLLYELLTGERLFKGEDAAETLAAVIHKQPDLERVPPRVSKLLGRCLEKDPKKRLRDIGEARYLLTEESAVAAPSPVRKAPWLWPAVAAALAVIAAIGYWAPWRRTRLADRPLLRFSADLGPDAARFPVRTVAISPDGTRIAFSGRAEGVTGLYTRRLDQPDATLLVSGTSDFPQPFFSPDGEWIGFEAGNNTIQKVAVQGGSAVPLGGTLGQIKGLSWGDDDNIVIGGPAGLWRLPGAGGMAKHLTEGVCIFPDVLPGSKAVLFDNDATSGHTLDSDSIEVLEFASGKRKTLIKEGYYPLYVPTSGETGHLLYMHEGTMFGVGFDPRKLELLGPPVPLLSDVAASNDVISGGGQFAASRTGTLVYLSGRAEGGSYPVLWMDAQGNTTPLVAQPGVYGAPRLSPDGRQLAYIASGNNGFDVWVDDLAGGTPTQLTFLGKVNNELAWAPDSKHLVYSDGSALWWIRSDGAGQAQLLKDTLNEPRPTSFAPSGGKDGRLLFAKSTNGLPDLMTLPIDMSDPEHSRAGKVEPFLAQPEIVEVDGAFSPDGKFIAYASNESGSEQIYVRPFPGPGGRWKVSADGGKFPAWSAATHELLFLGADDHIMAARYAIGGSGGDSFRVESPHVWSPRPVLRISVQQNFDVSRDGKRVVMFPKLAVQETGGDLHATFLINFFDELRRRVPLGGKK